MSNFRIISRFSGLSLPVRFAVLVLSLFLLPVQAQWTTITNGIEYQYFRVGNTNDIYVTRMSRTNAGVTIDTMFGQGRLNALETVRNQASRYDDAITWWGGQWGARNDVVVAINGGFYDLSNYEVSGGQIQSGWYSHFFADSFSGFAWRTNRTPFIGECVTHIANKVSVRFQANGNTQPIDGINRAPAASDLVIFTPQYNSQTPSGTRTEVLVEMSKPNLTTSPGGYSSGIIRSKAQNTGSTWIPFDHIVLSADGSDGTTLDGNASVGAEVRIFQELYEENEPTVQGTAACQTETGVNWANAFASINSNFHFLKNNVVRIPDAVAHDGYIGYVNLNPRTAICFNANYVFFVVVDGRSAQNKGIGCADLGYWAKAVLGATDGVNLDGGGSSTMVINGVVKNDPSDGNERAVCNGVMIVKVVPKVLSATFGPGQNVKATATSNLRLGPGSNYATFSSVANNAPGVVVTHQLNGVSAKGNSWWKCNFNGTTGWIAESLLAALPTAPFITQQPSGLSLVEGATGSFTAGAAGTSPLGYRWQKNNVNLSNGGHYSGATTPTLTLTGVASNDIANYRCVVTNAYGNTNSAPASLSLIPPVPCVGLLNADFEGGFSLVGGGYLANDWTEWEAEPGVVVGYEESAIVHGGVRSQRIRVWGATNTTSGGVYQRLPIAAGQPFTFNVWTYAADGASACSLGVDPAGGTNGTGGVIWSSANTNAAWVQQTVTGNATANYITVYLRVASLDINKRNGYFDDAAPVIGGGALQLSVERADPDLTLTWPECPGARLERAVGVTAPVTWATVTNQVAVSNGQKSVTLPPTESAAFFRLVLE